MSATQPEKRREGDGRGEGARPFVLCYYTVSFGAGFGDDLYSKEELIAEMGAAFLSAIAGIANEHTDRNTTAYIQNWISQLQEDNRLIVQAAANGQRAVDSIIGTTFESEGETEEREGEPAASGFPAPQALTLAA